MKKEVILTESEYKKRLKLFETYRGRVIPKEEDRLYSYIIQTGEMPRINKTGRVMFDVKKILGETREK